MKIHHTSVSAVDREADPTMHRDINDALLHSVLIGAGKDPGRLHIGDEVLSWVPGVGAYGVAVVMGEPYSIAEHPDRADFYGTYADWDMCTPIRWSSRRWSGALPVAAFGGDSHIPRLSGSTLNAEMSRVVARVFELD